MEREIKNARLSAHKRISDAYAALTKADLKRQQAFRRVVDSEGRAVESVVFLDEDGTALAVLTNSYGTASSDRDTMTCYTNAGKREICTYDYAATLKTASKDKYEPLLSDLQKVGYSVTELDKLPEEKELQLAYHTMMDSYRKHVRGLDKIADSLKRGDTIERDGKRGVVQYALYDSGENEVTVRWKVGDSSEEFVTAAKDAAALKVADADDTASTDTSADTEADAASETVAESEVADECGGGKKKFKIFKRGKKE